MWLHSLLEKAVVLHLNNFEFPLPNDAYFQVRFKWSRIKLKCEDTDRGADDRQQANKKLKKIRGGLSVMSPHCFNRRPPLTIVLGIALSLIRVKFYALFIYHFFPNGLIFISLIFIRF